MLAKTSLKQQLNELRHRQAIGFIRLKATIAIHAPLGWLAAQSLYPRIYWHGRDHANEYVALGAIQQLVEPDEVSQLFHGLREERDDSPHYYGALAFDPQQQGWDEFGACRFVLPRIELIVSATSAHLCLNLWLTEDNQEQEYQAVSAALDVLAPELPLNTLDKQRWQRQDRPDFAGWSDLVEQVTADDFQKQVQKVVLSRESVLRSEGINEPNLPWMLLHQWAQYAANCFHFGFQFSPEQAFISCSPERLYLREGTLLQTEALAGTIRRSGDEALDNALALALLTDSKNQWENQLVHADILQRLANFTLTTSLSEPRILKLRLLQHLKCDITATLKSDVCDWQLLNALHPTPAVGGSPRDAALTFIRDKEPYLRGWYAGACGMLSKERTEFSVAIRSARICRDSLSLYAGAGIVAGSEPVAEWAELDNKIANVLSLLE